MRFLVLFSLLFYRIALADNLPQYSFYDRENAATGSFIGTKTDFVSAVPFDKPWAALSSAEQERVKSDYEGLKPGDEPPFPEMGLGGIYRRLVRGTLEQKIEPGVVQAVAVVDARGEVQDVQFYKTPGKVTTAIVAHALLKTHFKAGLRDGKAVQTEYWFETAMTAGRQCFGRCTVEAEPGRDE